MLKIESRLALVMNYQFTIPVTGAIGSFDKIYSVRQTLQVC
jgi:hypothetical protein